MIAGVAPDVSLPPLLKVGGSALATAPATASQVQLFGNLECIVNLDAEISNRALKLPVAEQQVACAEIAGLLID